MDRGSRSARSRRTDRRRSGRVAGGARAWAPDIRATLREAVLAGDHARCVRITSSLERFWRARGEVGEARTILSAALASAPPDDHEVGARAAWTLARLAIAQGDPLGARAPLLEALALYRRAGSARETAFALTELAWVSLDLGELGEADVAAAEALEIASAAGDERAASSALSALATVASERGDPPLREGTQRRASRSGAGWAIGSSSRTRRSRSARPRSQTATSMPRRLRSRSASRSRRRWVTCFTRPAPGAASVRSPP